jgi:hypothetical protein
MGADQRGEPLLPGEGADAVRRAPIALAVLGFAGMAASIAGLILVWPNAVRQTEQPVRQKEYVRLIAEGVRYRDFKHFGLDCFSFDRCRVEKRRRGPVTFGAFNVLVVDGLVLNVPVETEPTETSRQDRLPKEGFTEAFLGSFDLGLERFSGVRIQGLTVNRSCSNRTARVFSAEQAESGFGKDGLHLQQCVIHTPEGGEARVSEARLMLKPTLALVYLLDGVEQRINLQQAP